MTRRPPLWLLALGVFAALAAALPFLGLIELAFEPPAAGLGEASAPGLRALLVEIGPDGGERWGPLPRTLTLAALVCLGSLALGTALAWLGARAEYPGRRVLVGLGLLPFAVPSYLLAMALRDALGPGGAIGELAGFGRFAGLGAVTLVLVLSCAPYAQILVTASLARLGGDEEDAARSLGAGPWRRFRRLLLPRIRPALAHTLLLVLLYTVSDFGVVDVLDCRVLTWRVYQAWGQQQIGLATVLGLGVLATSLPAILLARRIEGRRLEERGVANPRPPSRHRLGAAGRAVAYALHAFQVGLGVLLPAATMLSWVFPAAFRPEAWDYSLYEIAVEPALTSLVIAASATLLVVALVFAPAWLAARSGRRWAVAPDLMIHAANGIPGVLVAIGLIAVALVPSRALGRPFHDDLRQLGVLLLLGLALRFLAQAYGAVAASARRLDRRQEESAAALGAGPFRIFRRVQLPALAPGIGAASLLVALAVIKELPITLMLQPRDVSPLSYRLYAAWNEGGRLETGVAGLVMATLALGAHALARRLAVRRAAA